MEQDEISQLHKKLAQARAVIEYLLGDGTALGAEGERALTYFGGSGFDRRFLPWPRQDDGGKRPEELNAANDW